jgi:carbon-monoxide dehydrogenase medium subunit
MASSTCCNRALLQHCNPPLERCVFTLHTKWLAPTTLQEALELRARYTDDATVVAGGTFIGILMNQRLLAPPALLSLRGIHELTFISHTELDTDGNPYSAETDLSRPPDPTTHPTDAINRSLRRAENAPSPAQYLRIGAMTTHRTIERSALIRQHWPALTYTFSMVASPRIRNQATIGGVLADADYASDPPALLTALDASVVARRHDGTTRVIAIEELITGYYETSLQPDELLTEVHIPDTTRHAVYRKFCSRSSEDRPCVAVAAAWANKQLRLVVGAVAERPQFFPAICALANGETTLNHDLATEIGRRYAAAIDPISDARGSAAYRRRVVAVEVRRALEDLFSSNPQSQTN